MDSIKKILSNLDGVSDVNAKVDALSNMILALGTKLDDENKLDQDILAKLNAHVPQPEPTPAPDPVVPQPTPIKPVDPVVPTPPVPVVPPAVKYVAFSITGETWPVAQTNNLVNLKATITSNDADQNDVIVDFEVLDSNENRIFQQIVEHTNFTKGNAVDFATSFVPKVTGSFLFKVGVFTANWGKVLGWNDTVANLIITEGTPPPTPAPIPAPTHDISTQNPFDGENLFVDPNNDAAKFINSNMGTDADRKLMAKIANKPSCDWAGRSWVTDFKQWGLDQLKKIGDKALPIFPFYNIVGRDNGQYSSGGATDATQYINDAKALAEAVGARKVIIPFEPDALAQSTSNAAGTEERYNMMTQAINALTQNPNAYVYVDVAHSHWLKPEDAVTLLRKINIKACKGFVINISNFVSIAECHTYGQAIISLLNTAGVTGKTYIVDTSRNGNGADAINEWCNPSGRALGNPPTGNTGVAGCDAYLWIKFPTGSDGTRSDGRNLTFSKSIPPAGAFYPEYALELAANTHAY